jgi:DNA invertase Pin-like site-specific DNA recombinase
MMSSRRAAIYGRVSTDWQTTENQTVALKEVAERRSWEVVEVYIDHAISGAKGRDKRPGFDQTPSRPAECPGSVPLARRVNV